LRHIPADRPIYALQARGIMQPQMAPETLDEMAADYLEQIQQLQPIGPYNLLGWSFGGLVAHAIATRLQGLDEKVALLALLDSYPSATNGQPPDEEDLDEGRFLAEQIKALGYYGGDEPLSVSDALDILRREGDLLSTLEEHQVTAIIEVFKANARLAGNFAPQRFDGDVLLLTATEGEAPPPPDTWKPYVSGKIDTYAVDCEHIHMMRPIPLAKIGLVLASELDKKSRVSNQTNQAEPWPASQTREARRSKIET
jgi:thioesterase domain-containing protein